jgi:hypothetical protein
MDDEQQVALAHDLPVLEMGLCRCAADLGPQLDPLDRRELAEEAGPDSDLALQGLADRDDRSGCQRRRSLVPAMGSKAEPQSEAEQSCSRPSHRQDSCVSRRHVL